MDSVKTARQRIATDLAMTAKVLMDAVTSIERYAQDAKKRLARAETPAYEIGMMRASLDEATEAKTRIASLQEMARLVNSIEEGF